MQVLAFRENGDTSNVERVFLYKDSGATAGTEGDPFTGLTFTSTGLNISTIANNEAAPNTDTSAATSSIEAVGTLGTYGAPTAGFVRFSEVDATDMPGLYELQWEDARYAISNAIWLDMTISGVADLAPFHGRIMLGAFPTAADVVDEWESQSQNDPTGFHVNILEVSGTAEDLATATAVADVPTVSEFDARTLVAAAYFDPANDDVAVVTLVNTTTVATDAEADIAALNDAPAVSAAVIADAVWDEVLTGSSHNIATSAGRRLRQLEQAFVMAEGIIATATDTHTFTLDTGAVATADYYIGARLQIEEGVGAGQSRIIADYSVGRVVILDSDFTTIPNTSSRYSIVSADVQVSISDLDLGTGFVAVYTNTTTITLDATQAPATTDFYVGEIIVFTHGAGAGQAREITAYTSGRVVTMAPALITDLDTTTTWHVVAAVSIPEIVTELEASQIGSDLTQLQEGIIYGTVGATSLSTTTCSSNLTGFTADQLIGRIIIFTSLSDGPATGEATEITDYAVTNGVLTFTALTLAPENTDSFKIV